jgi:hypothetical protein
MVQVHVVRGSIRAALRRTHGALAAVMALSMLSLVPKPGSAAPLEEGAQRLAAVQSGLPSAAQAGAHSGPAARTAWQQPLVESSEANRRARSDLHALLPHGLPALAAALHAPRQWCDALLAHVHVRRCTPGQRSITLHMVTRADAPASNAEPLTLAVRSLQAEAGYFRMALGADEGPMGLSDLEIVFEAIPAGASASFVHLGYQAGASTVGNWVMQAYLATRGRDKVGFSAAPGEPAGTIRGARGVVERQAMRYHLALATYLDSLALPEADRAEFRLGAWFDAIERFPRQLHDLDRDTYLALKHRDLLAAGH